MTRMKTTILNTITTDINLAVNMIVNMYTDAAKPMKLKTNKFHITHSQLNWLDENCEKLKKEKYRKLRQFRINSTPENLIIYKTYKNNFKQYCQLKQTELCTQYRQQLVESRSSSNLFWKTVKFFRYNGKQQTTNSISSTTWLNHFKSLLYNEDKRKCSL